MIEQGTILDNTYKVVRAIGLGGGGEIYLADHLRLEKPVVIKKIKDNMQGIIEDRGEADILKKLSHSYLPQVYDFFVENGRVYTVMEYIEGENFQQLLKKGIKFSAKEIIKWGTQLSEVVAYLHAQKPAIIHRDIKPENVMLTPQGNICLIDFNVSFDQNTKRGVLAHSDGYSPPEQYGVMRSADASAAYGSQAVETGGSYENHGNHKEDATEILQTGEQPGQAYEFTEILSDSSSGVAWNASADAGRGGTASDWGRGSFGAVSSDVGKPVRSSFMERQYEVLPMIDERSDIYSLGATLYHLITLKRPEKSTEAVTPLSECNVKASDGLVYIIEKAMQKEPEKRFQTADKMRDAFLNIRKLDHEYIAYALKRDVLTGICIALTCVSAVCVVLGHKKMKQEAYNAYVAQIESANEQRSQGMFAEASETCKSAIAMRPDDLAAYIELGNIYYLWQYYGEGVSMIQQLKVEETLTEERKAQWATLQFLAGECYMGLEEFSLAAQSYKKAIGFQPTEGSYYTRCAIALAREGDQEGAEQFLEDALQKGISDAAIYLTKAEITMSGKKYAEAEELVQKAIEMSKDGDISYHAYLTGVQIYEDCGAEIADALEKERTLLEEAVRRLDANYRLSLLEKLADVYYGMAKQEKDERRSDEYYEAALQYFDEIYQNGYKNIHVLQNIAAINQTLGDYEEAETVFFAMIDLYPEDYRGYMYLTQLYAEIQNGIALEKRDYNAVFEQYEQAERLYRREVDRGGSVDSNMQMLGNLIEDIKKMAN